ncbi:MAG TPA: diacylglycerol kinase family protein [Geobacteraceae bacterium]|nr:diacylglycerol kinase family protein [Geobacteraceae bacterium]
MPGDCAVIINRLSGTYSEEKADQVKSFLDGRGLSPRLFFTHDLDEATVIARRICSEKTNPLIIVGGGDGTINGVLNGLSPGAATMAILPFGTSNVLTRELAIHSLEDALQRIAKADSRPVSVGLIEKDDARRYFLLMAGIGFDGSVVQGVQFREKKFLGKGAYVLSAIRHVIGWDKTLMEVTDENGIRNCHSLIVCNCSKYAGEFMIAPEASLFDPLFEAVCISSSKRRSYLHAALKMLTGRSPHGEGISSFRARELTVSGDKPIQIDGDFYCRTPVKISIVPEFVRLIV